MIAFCTSFRARLLANDWQYHVWLLERVVHSMLAQTHGDVQVVVACHDVPESRLRHDSPGGWTAGETRWTLAHEHGWFNSPDYRIFLLVILFVTVTWAFGTTFAHQYCG